MQERKKRKSREKQREREEKKERKAYGICVLFYATFILNDLLKNGQV